MAPDELRAAKIKILFLQKRILFPVDCGWRIRTLNVLRHLARWHDVTYVCNTQSCDENHLDEMRALGMRLETVPWQETSRNSFRFYIDLACNLFSPFPFTVNKDYDPKLRAHAAELLNAEEYDLLICDFVQMARNVLELPAPKKLLFQHNVEAQIYERHVRDGRGWLRRKYMSIQWRKMRRFEAEAGRCFDTVIAVSEQDRQTFQTDYGWQHVRVIDTATDVDFFSPRGGEEIADRIVFVGSLDWLPNQDGVRYFVEHIWPIIRAQRPTATFQVVGRNPPSSLSQLEASAGVEVVGTVDDVRPYLAAASVVVVPLWVGGGTRLKIFEALAMDKAVVSTSLGAEGLQVHSGEHILIADGSEDFAARVLELLENNRQRRELAKNGRELVLESYSAESVARQFDEICLQTVDSKHDSARNA